MHTTWVVRGFVHILAKPPPVIKTVCRGGPLILWVGGSPLSTITTFLLRNGKLLAAFHIDEMQRLPGRMPELREAS